MFPEAKQHQTVLLKVFEKRLFHQLRSSNFPPPASLDQNTKQSRRRLIALILLSYHKIGWIMKPPNIKLTWKICSLKLPAPEDIQNMQRMVDSPTSIRMYFHNTSGDGRGYVLMPTSSDALQNQWSDWTKNISEERLNKVGYFPPVNRTQM